MKYNKLFPRPVKPCPLMRNGGTNTKQITPMKSFKNLTPDQKETIYLDWVNNYLTTEKMAIDYDCSQTEIIAIIDEVRNMPKPERIEFTKISCNHAGHPRYVVHFLNFLTAEELKEIRLKYPDKIDLDHEYSAALKKARKIGGRKFHNKQYGGGIVFTAFDTYELEIEILKLKNSWKLQKTTQ